MEIYLIRHTTPKIDQGICYGQSDLNLVQNYHEEFAKIKRSIKIKKPEIYSSPLKRCKILAKNIGEDIIVNNKLKELNFGDWELKAWDEIDNDSLSPWMSDFVNKKPPNGESYKELDERANEAFMEIVTKSISKEIIIVTHAGVMRAIIARLMNLDLKDSFKIKLEYGHIIKLVKHQKKIDIIDGLIIQECN